MLCVYFGLETMHPLRQTLYLTNISPNIFVGTNSATYLVTTLPRLNMHDLPHLVCVRVE